MAQMVERVLGKDEVTGSIPVSSSKNPAHFSGRDFYFLLLNFSLLLQIKFDTGFLGSKSEEVIGNKLGVPTARIINTRFIPCSFYFIVL